MRLFKKRIRDKSDNCPYCNESSDRLFYKHVAYAHQHKTATQACGTPMLRAQQLADEESAVEHATNDDIYDVAAVELVRERQRAGTAILQRHFRIGYARAARLIDRMEDLDRKLVEYTNNDTPFQLTSAYLLELASKAKNIFERSQPEQKNKILRMLLANPTLKAKRLQLPLLKPFASVLDNSNSQNWLTAIE